MKGKVIGIGGIFLKFHDPEKMNKWYAEVLGLTTNDYGVLFGYNHTSGTTNYLQLGTFPADTDYFGDKKQQVMLNFRVDDIESLLIKLKEHNVKVLDELAIYDYGKFIHISDPEGNRIELWEPIDRSFDEEKYTKMF